MLMFGYTQIIPRYHIVSAPPTFTRRHMYDMFDDYERHLIPEEARSTINGVIGAMSMSTSGGSLWCHICILCRLL